MGSGGCADPYRNLLDELLIAVLLLDIQFQWSDLLDDPDLSFESASEMFWASSRREPDRICQMGKGLSS